MYFVFASFQPWGVWFCPLRSYYTPIFLTYYVWKDFLWKVLALKLFLHLVLLYNFCRTNLLGLMDFFGCVLSIDYGLVEFHWIKRWFMALAKYLSFVFILVLTCMNFNWVEKLYIYREYFGFPWVLFKSYLATIFVKTYFWVEFLIGWFVS